MLVFNQNCGETYTYMQGKVITVKLTKYELHYHLQRRIKAKKGTEIRKNISILTSLVQALEKQSEIFLEPRRDLKAKDSNA